MNIEDLIKELARYPKDLKVYYEDCKLDLTQVTNIRVLEDVNKADDDIIILE